MSTIGVVARTAVTVGRAAAVAVVARRFARARHAAPRVTIAQEDPDADPVITVVVPARDEEGRLAAAVRSVIRAPEVAEVIVVDDDSSDATVDVARAAGAAVVRAGPPPPGWAGKTWAAQQGLERATTEWVMWLDADARVDERLPAALVERARRDGTALLSIAGRTGAAGPATTAVHAALLATLVVRFGPPGTVHGTGRGRVLVAGQCLVARREEARAWGGWRPVAASFVEDVALARWLVRRGHRVAWLDALDLLTVEPYASARRTLVGWGRSIGLAGVEPTWRRVVDATTVGLVTVVPAVRLARRRTDAIDVVALAMRLGLVVGTARAFERRGVGFWVSPVADPLALAVLAADVVRRRETWRGRTSWR